MNLRTFLIPTTFDAKQALRLHRFGLAALGYLLSIIFLVVAWWYDVLAATACLEAATAFLAVNVGVYAAIRSGFNLRFKDPSLTLFQILAAITVAMYVTFNMQDNRSVALYCCFYILLFGTFHLRTSEFAIATIYTLASYALVILMLQNWRPEAIHDIRHEWMSWLVLALFLPWYSIVGGQINALRRKARATTEELRLFTDNVPAMTVSYDENLHCRFVNKRFAEFFGRTVEQTLGLHLKDVVGAETFSIIEGHYAQVLGGQPVTYHRTHRLPGGENRHLEIKLLPHMDAGGKCLGCFSVAADITEHKLTEERMQRVAHYDSLTELPNRILFNDRLNQAIHLAKRDSSQFALLYIDLDRFKTVNDRLGHSAGDELLKQVARRIREEVRESDTVARVGGDEFTVILSDTARRDDAEAVADKIVAAIAAPFAIGGNGVSVEVGASIGIAVYPSEGQDADELVQAADSAMYGAKRFRTSSMSSA